MELQSVQIGKVRPFLSTGGRESTSAIVKETVDGPVNMGSLGLAGDEQANRRVHGGPDKAINVYCLEHHAAWEREIGRPFPAGAAGENFTVLGALEDAVCIGDVYEIGEVQVEVSQPREPCGKLAAHWNIPDLIAQIHANGRSGWYFRVLQGGMIAAPAKLERIARPFPEWTISRANQVMHFKEGGAEAAQALAACPALAESWRTVLRKRVKD
jgi:MOSC domain-containing protein YiiM